MADGFRCEDLAWLAWRGFVLYGQRRQGRDAGFDPEVGGRWDEVGERGRELSLAGGYSAGVLGDFDEQGGQKLARLELPASFAEW